MVLQCSHDGGKSYPWRKVVTSFLARGGYSDLKILEDGRLLMVWEDYPTNNIFSQVLETSWCGATRGGEPAQEGRAAHDGEGGATHGSMPALSVQDGMPGGQRPEQSSEASPAFPSVGLPSGSLPSAAGLRSGSFVPLADDAGFLACPQSLSTFDGLGHCVGIEPLGVTVGLHASLDLYVQCSAQVCIRMRMGMGIGMGMGMGMGMWAWACGHGHGHVGMGMGMCSRTPERRM